MSTLVIVESPTKAKTIQKFLGSGYIVKASFGHIRDLEKKTLSIDVKNNFEPSYVISSPDKVKMLRAAFKTCNEVILASDEDREGEAIAWHVSEVLKLRSPKRIVFHEITKKAIDNAIKNPRKIDMNMVNAQQARRILDRLVGFELSPILWNYIKGELSAGRVQSIATRLIVDREKEIIAFQTAPYFKVNGIFTPLPSNSSKQLFADLDKHITDKNKTMEFLDACKTAIFTIEDIECKLQKRNPSPPFITSSLQQEAGRKLHMSAKQIMGLAQKLYEAGYITYHRTDCTLLSSQILTDIKAYIEKNYGENYVHIRQYQTKSKNAQEAHEAIRPTDISTLTIKDMSEDENKLYQMIWKRTVASQMKACEVNVFKAIIKISNRPDEKFIAKAEEIIFDGYLKVYNYKQATEEDEDSNNDNDSADKNLVIIKALKIGDKLNYSEITAKETYSKPPARYTEPTLNKKMEILGIGRPSTYASIINTIQERGYVEKKSVKGKQVDITILLLKAGKISETKGTTTLDSDKNKLFPTEIGIKTTDFLMEKFANVLEYSFTSKMEDELDCIAEGKKVWQKVIEEYYGTFHPIVAKLLADKPVAERQKKLVGVNDDGVEIRAYTTKFGSVLEVGEKKYRTRDNINVEELDAVKAQKLIENSYPRQLGMLANKPVVLKEGKFGIYMDYGGKSYNISAANGGEITFEMAKEIIESENVGDYNGKPIQLKNGKFGKYLVYNGNNYNLKSQDDEITVEYAIEIIEEKNKKTIKIINDSIKIMNGPYGAYINFGGKRFVSIPKDRDPAIFTLQDCKNLDEIDKIKKGNATATGNKFAAAKKTTYTKKYSKK